MTTSSDSAVPDGIQAKAPCSFLNAAVSPVGFEAVAMFVDPGKETPPDALLYVTVATDAVPEARLLLTAVAVLPIAGFVVALNAYKSGAFKATHPRIAVTNTDLPEFDALKSDMP